MKKFISKLILFKLTFIFILALAFALPATPRVSKSLLFGKIKKDSLLKNSLSPKIIFIGGSNLSFGLNSQIIKDSLKRNPINTAIHVNIGIKHMIDNTFQYIKKNDIVVIVLEYSHYYKDLNHGTEELLRSIVDINFKDIKHLNIYQIVNLIKYIPKYSLSKVDPTEYFNIIESEFYSINSFNQFGDANAHWNEKRKIVKPYDEIKGDFNLDVLNYIEEFNNAISNKGAALLVSYPTFQASSFDNNIKQIKKVEDELINSGFELLGYPERYKMNDSLIFDTPYHLSKEGVDLRTQLLIEDIKKSIKNY